MIREILVNQDINKLNDFALPTTTKPASSAYEMFQLDA
jgi:hypothetical protein